MRSKNRDLTVKVWDHDHIPQYIKLNQRHFEKEGAAGVPLDGGTEFRAKLDLVRMSIPGLGEDVEEVCIVYKKS